MIQHLAKQVGMTVTDYIITCALGADAVEILREQKRKINGTSEYVFPSPSGGPISSDSVLHMLHRVLKRAGLPKVRFHDLSHPDVKHTTKNILLKSRTPKLPRKLLQLGISAFMIL